MYFTDRTDAAYQLRPLLAKYKGSDTVVLAIPRGGVPIGIHLARYLGASLDLLMSKKIGAPGNPEYAIGAVCPEGVMLADIAGISETYIQEETEVIRKKLQERYQLFRGGKKPIALKDKTVIITDDGIATGRTILAAIPSIKKQQPRSLVVAAPVCSVEAQSRLLPLVDDLICCFFPDPFIGVARFYTNFAQVEDEEVIQLLQEFN